MARTFADRLRAGARGKSWGHSDGTHWTQHGVPSFYSRWLARWHRARANAAVRLRREVPADKRCKSWWW